MTIPDYQTLMLPVLRVAAKGEVYIAEVVDQLSDEFHLSTEEREQLLPSGKQEIFSNRVRWAKSYLNKARLIEITRRGHFRITERGTIALNKNLDRIDNKFLSQFEEFRNFRNRALQDTPQDNTTPEQSLIVEQTPDEAMREAYQQIQTSLAQDLLDKVRTSSPAFFEKLIVTLLLKMGYGGTDIASGRPLGRSGDGGVDGVIDQDVLGLDQVYIQAKRYAEGNNISAGAIRDFAGSLDIRKAHKGMFVTTSTFTPAANDAAKHLSKRIVLIDGMQLALLMLQYNVGSSTEETLYIKKIDEDFFEEQ